jgi:hypothetical protein
MTSRRLLRYGVDVQPDVCGVDWTTTPFSTVAVIEDAPQTQVGESDDRLTVAPADAVQATTTVRAAPTMTSVLVCGNRKIPHCQFAPPPAPWAERLNFSSAGPMRCAA